MLERVDGKKYCQDCKGEPMKKARAKKQEEEERKKREALEKMEAKREKADAALAALPLSPTEAALTAAISKLDVETLRICISQLGTAPPKRSLPKPALCAALLRLLLPQLGGAAGATAPKAPAAAA